MNNETGDTSKKSVVSPGTACMPHKIELGGLTAPLNESEPTEMSDPVTVF
ncbi:MAG TPA: hypothetical protein PLD39_07500 [Flexilinea sp.]|nr:hypothetical protein [Flexilinea sp.]